MTCAPSHRFSIEQVKTYRIQRLIKWCIIVLPVTGCLLKTLDTLYPVNVDRYHDISTIVYSRDDQALHISQTRDSKWRLPTMVADVDPQYLKTLVMREDRNFRRHWGVNLFAVLRAGWQWLSQGHIVSGASTLTMQTVRLLDPQPRTLWAKTIECLKAIQLEWHYSKDQILNMYLTLAPFGGNVEGVKAAVLTYFNKSPQHLSSAEIALLVALPQAPTRLRPYVSPVSAGKARQRVLQLMIDQKLISGDEFKDASAEVIPLTRYSFPSSIPHLARYLKHRYPQQDQLSTTIDASLQKRAESILRQYSSAIPDKANAGIMIMQINSHDNQVMTYIGSRDFGDHANQGQIDYNRVNRSPGSTLKPFIYGLAFDLGLAQPDTLVLDDRQRFGPYAPNNFDKNHYGMVSITDALKLSLNIPVVALLRQIGPVRFMGALKEVGIDAHFNQNYERPSLAIALGGLGLRLEQLMILYGGLVREGEVKTLCYLRSEPSMSKGRLLTTHAARQITQILSEINPILGLSAQKKIAIKTGTSYGHRDMWALGYDNGFVVGVWFGLPSNLPMGNHLSAQSMVVPLLLQLFEILPASKTTDIFQSHVVVDRTHVHMPELKQLKNTQVNQQSLLYKLRPRMLFPVDRIKIEYRDEQSHPKAIPLTVTGGQKPYTWLIDGEPLAEPTWRQKSYWTPQQSGYYKITVLDAQGHDDHAYITLD